MPSLQLVIHRRHDGISYELKSLAAIALVEKSVQTEPIINPGSASVLKSKRQCNNNDIVTSIDDLRGDIIIKGLFERNQDCIIDVRVIGRGTPIILSNHRRQRRRRNIFDSVSSNCGHLCALCCVC